MAAMRIGLVLACLGGVLVEGKSVAKRTTILLDGYKLFVDEMSWTDAKAACMNWQGADLVTIDSRAENNFLYEMAVDAGLTDGFWTAGWRIGLGNSDVNFVWSLQTGDIPFNVNLPNVDGDDNHDLWVRNEPNNFKNKESCVRAGNMPEGRWNDARCEQEQAFICYRSRKCTV
jgi:hypothetical protein